MVVLVVVVGEERIPPVSCFEGGRVEVVVLVLVGEEMAPSVSCFEQGRCWWCWLARGRGPLSHISSEGEWRWCWCWLTRR